MSFDNCGVLQEEALHPWRYSIGTFAMHYLPFIIVLCDNKFIRDSRFAAVQVLSAASFFSLYVAWKAPTVVYRCPSLTRWEAIVGGNLLCIIYWVACKLLTAR